MNIKHITDINDTELAPYVRLTENQLRNRLHPDSGVFICESEKVIRVALKNGVKPLSILCEERQLDTQVVPMLQEYGVSVPIYVGERTLLQTLTGYALTRGILCAMQRPKPLLLEDIWGKCRRVVVVDNVVDSSNIGAIYRAAASLGVDAVVLTSDSCDYLNRRTVRVSMGSVFLLPTVVVQNLQEVREKGYTLVALALRKDAVNIGDFDFQKHERLAVVMGNEGNGLKGEDLQMCHHTVIIPMQRGVDSINVAAAAAITFYAMRG